MNVIVQTRLSSDKNRCYSTLNAGRGKGQRFSSGLFTSENPTDRSQRNHNKKTLAILEARRAQMILDSQSLGKGYIAQHKLKGNFSISMHIL